MSDLKSSYSAANSFPWKILHNSRLVELINLRYIPPVHIQLNLTNICGFNCSFCSCGARDRTQELSNTNIRAMLTTFKALGHGVKQSITITGGGEPLLHPNVNEIIDFSKTLGYDVGLVSNGVYIDKLTSPVVWCRISSSDELPLQLHNSSSSIDEWYTQIQKKVSSLDIEWAFSHVLSSNPDINYLARLIEFANDNQFTHVRLVSNILDLSSTFNMMPRLKKLLSKKVNIEKVIFQSRQQYVVGTSQCLISLLKPTIGADGFVYPCCGTQYALAKPSRDYEQSMKMVYAMPSYLLGLYEHQRYFDGSKCVKCYYSNYNTLLINMLAPLNDEAFL